MDNRSGLTACRGIFDKRDKQENETMRTLGIKPFMFAEVCDRGNVQIITNRTNREANFAFYFLELGKDGPNSFRIENGKPPSIRTLTIGIGETLFLLT